MKISTTIYICY